MPILHFENPLIIRAGTIIIVPSLINVYINDEGLRKELLEKLQSELNALTVYRAPPYLTPFGTLQAFISKHPELIVQINENATNKDDLTNILKNANIKLTPSLKSQVTSLSAAAVPQQNSSSLVAGSIFAAAVPNQKSLPVPGAASASASASASVQAN